MPESFDHRQASADTFEAIYAKVLAQPVDDIPKPPQIWNEALVRWAGLREGQSSAEVGCGSGHMSLALAQRGADVTLVDIAPSALAVAKRVFDHHGFACALRQGDLFDLDESLQYDVVWNAGVMEHFSREEILQGLTSMGRAVKPGGKLIIMVPSARGRLYTWGKRRLEAKGRWPYGVEYPMATLRDLVPMGFRLVGEDQVGVWSQADPALGCPRWVFKFMKTATGGNDDHPFWKKLVGGYLLLSTFIKEA